VRQAELGHVVPKQATCVACMGGSGKAVAGQSEQAGVGEKERRGREGCWATNRLNLGREKKKRAGPDLELG